MGILILSSVEEPATLEGVIDLSLGLVADLSLVTRLESTIDLGLSLEGKLTAGRAIESTVDLGMFLTGELKQAIRLESAPIDIPLEPEGDLVSNTLFRAAVDIGLTMSGELSVAHAPMARIYGVNRWDEREGGVVLASSTEPNYPLSNLYDQKRSRVWRSQGLNGVWIQRNIPNAYDLNSVCLVGSNMTRNGKFRVRIGGDPFFESWSYDSGWVTLWGPMLEPESIFGHEGTKYPGQEILDMLRFCHETVRTVRVFNLPLIFAAIIRIDFLDPENPDGFIELAWVNFGFAVTLDEGIAYDFQWMMNEENNVERSFSGRLWQDIYYRQMIVTAKIVTFPRNRFIGLWQFMVDYLGDNKEFVIQFRDDTFAEEFWMSMYCRFKEVPSFQWQDGETFEETIVFEELP